ncbi:MAG: ADP-ribose pyrophosphatase [Parcubacteria group bacterium GW2011_GWC1_42_11]|uniref:ADP-ribose pyrophosphatase n=1 Tax=Candidatus Nomurabacteria bacterium GW2011_GWC2_42_20 TaxID=1618756 RepID=A0A0G0ZGU8_9BACT|nr:MAG: ADP-ribose pyrophosphatase [Parcubacteria group bacterium GW2011_GWC1_42_11]KKS47937.1 MAG: ADP-ribose pyrophosphatase [Candidatus Nomurabacteria bacterium GW2011_GWC2_42_20]KKS58468.1 MAG: ADP-ribose pyrophosphatase [Candidatus Nomurabacteria bacterium GW2011_GWA2_42_41]KKT09704.1 MAG: ADP-ribose pyrophosphatase [Candidatus Nomurabacteria bacterium GW2011_GWB1_43_20]TAN36643.1 MAG: NUDIX domain-containing protein [Patescibacteria group bacterium]HBH71675.1 hypothetical protein [Candid
MNNLSPHLPAEKYKELMDISPICTVDVLFFNSDKTKTLLFKRKNQPIRDQYFSIGGRLLKNERLMDGAVRQSLREACVVVDIEKLTLGGTQDEINPNSMFDGINYHAVNTFYGYVLGSEEIKLDSQHSEYRWFPVTYDSFHPFIKTKIASLLKAYGKEL